MKKNEVQRGWIYAGNDNGGDNPNSEYGQASGSRANEAMILLDDLFERRRES
jgi:hypothetical protein